MNLKRIGISVCTALLVLCFTQSNAQDQRFRIGLKFSGNLSWASVETKNIERVGTSAGYSYGIMGDYYFQKFYALSTELLFTDIGTSIMHGDLLYYTDSTGKKTAHQSVQYDYKLKYVQIPISVKFRTKEFGYWTWWAQFGIAPSFLTQAKADITGKTVPFDDPTDIHVNKKTSDDYQFDNFEDKIKFMRMPLIIGAGFEYSLAGNTSLYSGLRIDNNFADMFSDKFTNAKNNFVSLNVGIFF